MLFPELGEQHIILNAEIDIKMPHYLKFKFPEISRLGFQRGIKMSNREKSNADVNEGKDSWHKT